MRGYYTTTVNTDVEVDIDLDEIFEDLTYEELFELVNAKGYSLHKQLDVGVRDVYELANKIILKKKSNEDYSKDMDSLLYALIGRF